jgi:hypothetical protein
MIQQQQRAADPIVPLLRQTHAVTEAKFYLHAYPLAQGCTVYY